MKKILIILFLIVFNARSEHKWYLNAGTEGIGLGYELKYKALLLHIGDNNSVYYSKSTNSLYYMNDSNATWKRSILNISFEPYLGVGCNIKLPNSLLLISYIDYLQGHRFRFGWESLTSSGKNMGTGYFIDYENGSWDLFRIEIGLIKSNWKLPAGIILDIKYLLDFFDNIVISPKIIIYL